jgi:23S rRNA-/tRNA-specific pseudouridylate synthase
MSPTLKISSPETQEYWEIPFLYEDNELLALNKPGGMLTSPDRLVPDRPSLMGLLHKGIAQGKPWAKERGLSYLMITHRLEAEASGVVLLAKSKSVFVKVVDFFNTGKPAKQCLALVQNQPTEDRFEVEAKIGPDPVRPGAMRINAKAAKHSHTGFEVQERFARYTLLKCELFTDRTHQIRLHLRYKGLPVVGDTLYGGRPLLLSRLKPNYSLKPNRKERPLIDRPAVHIESITLPYSLPNGMLTITSPWPKDLTVAVNYLRRYDFGARGPSEVDSSLPPDKVGA